MLLVDTGVFVSAADRSERWHSACSALLHEHHDLIVAVWDDYLSRSVLEQGVGYIPEVGDADELFGGQGDKYEVPFVEVVDEFPVDGLVLGADHALVGVGVMHLASCGAVAGRGVEFLRHDDAYESVFA